MTTIDRKLDAATPAKSTGRAVKLALAGLCMAAPVMIGGSLSATAQQPAALPALYTNAQADRGQTTWQMRCSGCHGEDMFTIFHGYETVEQWYLFSSGSMPADMPGSLENEEFADIAAYMMRMVGFPAGDTVLPPNRVVLRAIIPGDAPGFTPAQ